jgi:hypothetical protein
MSHTSLIHYDSDREVVRFDPRQYKLLAELAAKHVTAAIWLTNNSTDTAWFQRLAGAATAICFTRGRIHFISCDGTNMRQCKDRHSFTLGMTFRRLSGISPLLGLLFYRTANTPRFSLR